MAELRESLKTRKLFPPAPIALVLILPGAPIVFIRHVCRGRGFLSLPCQAASAVTRDTIPVRFLTLPLHNCNNRAWFCIPKPAIGSKNIYKTAR